ncbi:MAG: hypothetical protein IT427_06935 [Pirellulales bacterium]|nr:hypothetical protein [Pirellulales bacterium]
MTNPWSTQKTALAAVSYYREIRTLFQEHCHGCQLPPKKSGDYVMTLYAELLKAGESKHRRSFRVTQDLV